ncbi:MULTISPECIES: hypothetical protein [unclassified Paenibacillus]|uniref:DUF6843 domain-containing protein n=1 Tax=unclassified Paenibacillus TaxID=185978 RepID=UPI0009542A1D|nr:MULTISPECIES: hypothetical protein [unclassified Paenibacillus]ASS68350.1 hypothetical protein CIC07_21100 [Paenibacillus sp. RUD330]SIR30041.1 hypothetical protein SAMN05880555_3405 [Paenibacillus sp. RU4X]SIR41918.1 hypothetical protein SAMN05880570_3406 [Paenibacillus sp. RU4T]
MRSSLKSNRFLGALTVLLVLFILYVLLLKPASGHRYIVPEGYAGWVVVVFGQQGSPPLERQHGDCVYPIDSAGWLRTSSPMEPGSIKLYYRAADGSVKPAPAGAALIHGGGTHGGSRSEAGGEQVGLPAVVDFYVGTEEQYEQRTGESPRAEAWRRP